ncbi:MAG: hypothetical protein MHMPM18_003981 [Marteilia pararefringens]
MAGLLSTINRACGRPGNLCSASSIGSIFLKIEMNRILCVEQKVEISLESAKRDKRLKKVKREIKRLMKLSKKEIPVEEVNASFDLYLNKENLKRNDEKFKKEPVPKSISKQIMKEWTSIASKKQAFETKALRICREQQEYAIEILKSDYPHWFKHLSNSGPQFEDDFKIKIQGPSEFPPFKNYKIPDGDYFDRTKKFVDTAEEYIPEIK